MVRKLGTLRVGQLAPRSRYEGLDHVDEALRDDEVLGRQALKNLNPRKNSGWANATSRTVYVQIKGPQRNANSPEH